MTIMRLDRDGNAPIPKDYKLVTTEVEFLRSATEGKPLHIRGDRLCTWAETFFIGRGIPYQETSSYTKELQRLLPNLLPSEISGLIEILGSKIETIERPLQIAKLLITIAPLSIWHEDPSLEHLAEWFLWLDSADNLEVIAPLLGEYTSRWTTQEIPFDPQLYKIFTKVAAQETIKSWLGITDRDYCSINQEFPLDVPKPYEVIAQQTWREEIIHTRGAKFDQLSLQKIPFSLKKIAAEETFQYYSHHPDELDITRVASLIPYLKTKQISYLRNILPPEPPSALPNEPIGIINWYIHDYLPYREWQRSINSVEAKERSLIAAKQFEMWYLDNYPRGINGSSLHKWLSFNKINKINCPETSITLLIILDGMHVPDSRLLLQSILTQTQRLTVTANEFVFAPIPTVTRFAKEALLKGVPPNRAEDLDPLGAILPEKHSPALRLQNAELGKIYIWRVLEPDNTYHHKNTSENLLLDVEGRLEAEALKIKQIVESIPESVTLQIILTTDHGRLLSETHKIIDVPVGMESHGRAAWGKSPVPFTTDTYSIVDDIAYLMSEDYGMLSDVALPLDESAFKDNNDRTGSELFPHGGIFPEEVILPWIVLVRDLEQPTAKIIISGSGVVRREGTIQVEVINQSDLELTLETITLTLRTGITISKDLNLKVPARSPIKLETQHDPWPSAGEFETVQGFARIRVPNQMLFEYPIEAKLDSEDFYTRPKENILEDLE